MLKLIARIVPLSLLLLAGADGIAIGPRYLANGDLVPPLDYREWVFLGAGLDMSYSDGPPMAGQSMFDNVFADPAAWRAFEKTGHWPDKSMLVMENWGAESRGSINKHGQYESGPFMGAEIHIRDEARFKGGWGFFVLDGQAPAKLLPYQAQCYTCHQAHGAVDTTFTQFYPTAKPIAIRAGTYRER